MDKETNLLTLNEDVLYLIFTKLQTESPASLLQFANASKECERLTGLILYRSITLSDQGDHKKLSQTKRLFERLLKEDDSIHNYVKELKITEWGDEVDHSRPEIWSEVAMKNSSSAGFTWNDCTVRNGESQLLTSSKLECVFENLRELESFSWDTRTMIPERVIAKLEECKPNVRLSVTNNRRSEVTSDCAMDVRLLSSQLLYSLDYSIFYSITSEGIVCSELRKLKEILVQSQRLKILSLAVYPHPRKSSCVPNAPDDWQHYLSAGSGDPLLNLDTLKVRSRVPINEQSISKVYNSIFSLLKDFTNLDRINLTNLCTYDFFEQLKGRAPNLKHLRFSFRTKNWRFPGPIGHKCTILVRDFISSINALESLKITNCTTNVDVLFAAVLKHRHSLRRLEIHTPQHMRLEPHASQNVRSEAYMSQHMRHEQSFPPVLTSDQMEQLQESKISDLALDVLIRDITWFSKSDTGLDKLDLDPSTAIALAQFTRVETLKIYIELPQREATVFSETYAYESSHRVPPLIREKAEEVGVCLFQQIFASDQHASLRELELRFCRLQTIDGASWTVYNSMWVRKVDIDYINNPLDPGYAVEFQGNWESDSYE